MAVAPLRYQPMCFNMAAHSLKWAIIVLDRARQPRHTHSDRLLYMWATTVDFSRRDFHPPRHSEPHILGI